MRPFERAYHLLRERIAKARTADERLPTVAALAATAGVSVVTMWRALKKCRDEGLVSAFPRRGIRVLTGATGTPVPAATKTPAASSPEQALAMDLVRGRWQPGSRLPPYKTLAHEYGVGFSRLTGALRALAADRLLTAHGRGYAVTRYSASRTGGALALLCCRDSLPEMARLTQRVGELCGILEQECSARSVQLVVCNAETTGVPLGRLVRQAAGSSTVLGYGILPAGLSRPVFERATSYLRHDPRPVCILDPMGDSPLIADYHPGPRVCVVTIDSHFLAGVHVGRFLLQSGHRRIAYVSPYVRFPWCRDRLAGLRKCVAESGGVAEVVPFTDATLENYGEISAWITAQPWYADVRESVGTLETLTDTNLGASEHQFLDRAVLPGLIDRFIENRVRPLFASALKDRAITAWVATNDMVALLALRFLRERSGRPVAVVGFDDIPEASLNGLTSYGFNPRAVVQAGLNHVLGPHPRGGWRSGRTVVVPGVLVQRASTARALPPG